MRVTEQRPAPAPGRERFVAVDQALPPSHFRFASGCSPGVVCAQRGGGATQKRVHCIIRTPNGNSATTTGRSFFDSTI
ncbi:hypothetical protein AQJ27_30080 [Streptomyces olivochromogenes]|nr:hypothetical protein AQJ27_30080 [Streptomyces olivochromogenes]